MSKIILQNPTEQELKALNINDWAKWQCGISRFNWEYADEEICYIFEGEVVVETDIETVTIKAGNLVTFPKNLKCIWNIKKPIRKVYKFNY
jgi:uncharacterized cupin superfamily protein